MEALEHEDLKRGNHCLLNGGVDVVEPGGRDKDGAETFGFETCHGMDQGFGSGMLHEGRKVAIHTHRGLEVGLDRIEKRDEVLLIDVETVIGKGSSDRQEDRHRRAGDLQRKTHAITNGKMPG